MQSAITWSGVMAHFCAVNIVAFRNWLGEEMPELGDRTIGLSSVKNAITDTHMLIAPGCDDPLEFPDGIL